jgi:tetratricopeptide (TPR) repeat protein
LAATNQPAGASYEEYVLAPPDRIAQGMRWAIVVLVGLIICVLLYALLAGVFSPPAPRTLLESTLATSRAAVKENSASGTAWAALAGAQYTNGDTAAAWDTLTQARQKVKDHSILYVNNRELDFLLIEGQNAQVVKRADEFIKVEADYQVKAKVANAQKGIIVPDQVSDNTDAVRLFVLKGTAQGNLGQWKEAVKTFDTALQLDDKAADIITLRGWARLRSGDAAGAKKDFARALRYMPGDPSATSGLKASEEASAAK